MQAQPQSNLAARILTPSSSSLAPPSPLPQALPAPHPAASVADSVGLAHDAGNLLAALGLYSELLSAPGVLRPEHQHYATELRLISNRSAELIRRLLHPPPKSPPPTAAAPLLPPNLVRLRNARVSDILASTPNHAATLLSLAPVLERIAAGAAAVTVTCPISLPPLTFSSEIIERITVNLVRNAAEAIRLQQAIGLSHPAPVTGIIRVTLAVIAYRLQLSVEDNGPGMTPANVDAYLQPRPLPLGANHGLGHRIVHELTAASEGDLSIRVSPGHGTIFSITWPLPSTQPAEPCRSDGPQNPSIT